LYDLYPISVSRSSPFLELSSENPTSNPTCEAFEVVETLSSVLNVESPKYTGILQ
jgi:hypothetical protein